MIRTLRDDLRELVRSRRVPGRPLAQLVGAAASDGFAVVALFRLRATLRRHRVPAVPHLLRLLQTAVYGVEVDDGALLGRGVYFVHTVGTVIGQGARVGHRVRLMGSNVLGTARDDGYPVVGDDVVVGIGARVLGPVRIGDGAVIGAGAVVLEDVPAGAVAVGVPARILPRRPSLVTPVSP